MFQYATARALSISCKTNLMLDIGEFDTYSLRSFELDKYNVQASVIHPNSYLRLLFKKLRLYKIFRFYHIEKKLQYDKKLKTLGSFSYLEGYFQCEKYFSNIREEILSEFSIIKNITKYAREIEKEILSHNCSISLHIRRSDYALDEKTNNIHGLCDLSYYEKAISLMSEKFNNPKYFIFSDDIKWAENNLKNKDAIYVKNIEERNPHEDIYLMSLCKHNIIANSSFSWWGAWLNENNNKIVVSPKKWFKDEELLGQSGDIACQSWIKL